MPTADDKLSTLSNVTISNFWGLDASRSRVENQDYGVGARAVNLGRNQRMPMAPRPGLRPLTSSNGNHNLAGSLFALGALATGNRLTLIARISGGMLVAAKDVEEL